MRKNFIRGDFSFRYSIMNARPHWAVYPKGERSHWSARASIYEASDGQSYVVSAHGRPLDARPDFKQAVALALEFAQALRIKETA